jgi:WD40 repeat protein
MALWDLGDCPPKPRKTEHADEVTALAVTQDGRQVISGCDDGVLRIWDLKTGQQNASLTGHERGITALAVTRDGRLALSSSRDRVLKL